MFHKIKSKSFLKLLFSKINEKIKLEMIKNNKDVQTKIGINIINYKIFSKKYKVYQKSKGKEYDIVTNNILFEGEYLNQKRNGKGKEYNKYKNLIFEGEYKNGKRNGKGKEFYDNNKLYFEGEYNNGKKWNGRAYDLNGNLLYVLNEGKGTVKEYDYSGYLIFEGEYLNGQREGKGKEYKYNKIIFEGKYKYEKRNGEGKEYDINNNLIFEGKYYNDKKWDGKGYNKNKEIFELKNGKGKVNEYQYDLLLFEGDYSYGEKNGKGKEYYYNKTIQYEGEYLDGKRNGNGKEYNIIGNMIFEGKYLYDEKIRGKRYINGNLEYEGDYLYEKKWNGKGYDENGNIIYELINGNGKVKEYDNDDVLIFDGEYLDGKKYGKGKEYNSLGKLIFEGDYQNDKKIKGIEYEYI